MCRVPFALLLAITLQQGCDEDPNPLRYGEGPVPARALSQSDDGAILNAPHHCPYPTMDVQPAAPDPNLPIMSPYYVTWELYGDVSGQQLNDWHEMGGPDHSARIRFMLWSGLLFQLCTVTYDADFVVVGPSDQVRNDRGKPLLASWDLVLSDGMAEDGPGIPCRPVDPAVFGSSDIRDYLEQWDWSMGIGPLDRSTPNELYDRLQGFVSPADWNANYDPYIMGLSMSIPMWYPGRNQPYEVGYGWGFDHDCADWPVEPTQAGEYPYVEVPHQETGTLSAGYIFRGFWAYNLY